MEDPWECVKRHEAETWIFSMLHAEYIARIGDAISPSNADILVDEWPTAQPSHRYPLTSLPMA